uniref:probable disease resistance protein At4g27220 isoform X2 n=1 Tax=Fragaria vesca subsp. vesca TaxID=101020 RepID=UPI0005C8A5CE|nr:PREDICTED: probable disease resistance protein At4g27220 isoform X2 [Fragaria vesca subsp. vesca]
MASPASLPSSAESPTACPSNYDVFLSFSGLDTRKGITSELYERLHKQRGIITFMDDRDLEPGDPISRTLLKAIEASRFAIVVLSPNYASSTWCLEELAKICECMKDQNRILPLFYKVEPSDVRHRKGSFGEAFDKHKSCGRHTSEQLEQWSLALNKVASFTGWHTKNYKTDRELVEEIVDSVCNRIRPFEIDLTLATGDFEVFEATNEAMGEVMKVLQDDDVGAVVVYGMGGVGKTTLVKYVGADARQSGIFHYAIMAVVSQSPDIEKIQGTLADMLGVKLEGETEFGRAVRLKREIMRREKILIMLDDVWQRIELSNIGIPSYEELQKFGSKVLFTTRKLNVCHAMSCQEKIITLNVLSEKDSWTLFLRNAGTIESTAFEEVARRVAKECKGLPIALIAVARALKGEEDLKEWEKASQQLEKSQYANPNHEEDDKNAFKCIRLSYDFLKNKDHKSCFLLCCMFPEDHEIKIEDLFRYAMGKRLFPEAETMEVARGRLVTVVKYLKGSSLLLDSKKKGCVKMHDVIRDTALQIAESEDGHQFFVKAGCGLKGWPPHGLQEYCIAISLMNNKICKLPEDELVFPNLHILLLNGNAELSEIPEKLIQNLKELRVLDLSNTSISVLPESFSVLTNLQVLNLDDCDKLIDISIVGKLKKLEILSMRDCPGGKLSREIGHLTNLRILDVNRSCPPTVGGMVTIPSRVISKLHKLEELYMVYCGFKDRRTWTWRTWFTWCVFGIFPKRPTNIIRFDKLAGLSNLKILQVGLSDESFIPKNVEAAPDWDYFCISIIGRCTNTMYASAAYEQGDHNSRSLILNGATISTLPDWFINAVIKKTKKLKYDRCGGMSDIVMEYDHGRLHKLKHLIVSGYFLDSYVYLTELMNTTTRVETGPMFESLEELYLLDLIHLEELCVGELPPGSLSNLKILHMNSCCILKSVSKFVQRLPNLEKLHLHWMKELKYVFGWEGCEPEQSKLREMHLLSLRALCNGHAPCAMFLKHM